jgi:hypothetical protein
LSVMNEIDKVDPFHKTGATEVGTEGDQMSW